MKNITAIIILLLTVMAAPAVSQSNRSDSVLSVIESAYSNGQFLNAELEARRLLESEGLSDSAEVQTEKWIAFALIAQGKTVSARERFLSMLLKDETFELDRMLTSPKILTVFNEARARFIALRNSFSADSVKYSGMNGHKAVPSVSIRTILFPGWEQIHQGREGIGYAFLGAGAVTLSSGILFEYLRSDARQQYLSAAAPSDISAKYDTYDTYRKAEIYSFAAFAAVYILSEIDVFTSGNLALTAGASTTGVRTLSLSMTF